MHTVILSVFGVFWSGLGIWVLLRALPEVRLRIRSGVGTPSDDTRLKKNQMVGMVLIISGLLAIVAGVLQS
jgi:hypothetical protein